MLWSAPLQIILATALLWQHLGVASLASLIPMILFIPLQSYMAKLGKKYQLKKLKQQDSRIKITNEVLSGMKVNQSLKVY
jgi:hypothetical protein